MIITRTPLRISFTGGGTDIKDYYQIHGGAVVSATINKYIYITVNRKFDQSIRVSYSKTEIVPEVRELQHELVRESLRLRNGRQIVLWTLFSAWLVLVVFLSSEDGLSTARTSGRLAALFVRLFYIRSELTWRIDHTLRMSAHFVGFFILSGLAYTAVMATWADLRFIKTYAILFCAVLSILDEVKKVFIPGRHLSWSEVGINVLGVLCGVFISMMVEKISGKAATPHSRA